MINLKTKDLQWLKDFNHAHKKGEISFANKMLKAIERWNKEVGKTETSIEFEVFIKDELKKLKK